MSFIAGPVGGGVLSFPSFEDLPASGGSFAYVEDAQELYVWTGTHWALLAEVSGVYAAATAQGMTFTAQAPGVGGNDIDVDLVDPGSADQPLDVSVAGSVITVSLESGPEEGGEPVASGQGGTWTLKADRPAGDMQSVALYSAVVGVSPLIITPTEFSPGLWYFDVQLAQDEFDVITTTMDDLVAAWPSSDAFEWATLTGSGNTPITPDEYFFAPAGGYSLISTTSEVVAAVNADTEAYALVIGVGGDDTVATEETISLSGGA